MGKLETLPAFAPMPAVSRVLAQFDRQKLGAAIEVMIALLDMTEPDADTEGTTWPEDLRAIDRELLPDDSEAGGDNEAGAYIEWHATAPSSRKAGHCIVNSCGHEDDEEDDPGDAEDEGEPDFAKRRSNASDGPGCTISDTDACTAGDDRVFGVAGNGPGDADDAELWQNTSNVPMLPVLSAEHNIFTDKRVSLGISNLQTSYRTNIGEVRSADTGNMHRLADMDDRNPGKPV